MKLFWSIGSLVSIILSYCVNHSIFWSTLHACMSWVYVVIWFLKYTKLCEWINQLIG